MTFYYLALGSIQISCGPAKPADMHIPILLTSTLSTVPPTVTQTTTSTVLPPTTQTYTQYTEPKDPFINEVDRQGQDKDLEDHPKDGDGKNL